MVDLYSAGFPDENQRSLKAEKLECIHEGAKSVGPAPDANAWLVNSSGVNERRGKP